jgi:hypothetical protein
MLVDSVKSYPFASVRARRFVKQKGPDSRDRKVLKSGRKVLRMCEFGPKEARKASKSSGQLTEKSVGQAPPYELPPAASAVRKSGFLPPQE